MKIPQFLGGTDEQRSKNLSDNKLINLYPVTNNDGSVSALYKVEGLKEEATLSGIPTGAYKTTTNRAFYVSGTTLYELNSDLTSTSRGTLTAGNYSFSDNGIELICVNGTNGWLFTLATNTLTQIKVLTGDVTITVASPAVLTKTSHGLVAGDRVILSTTGVLPDGFTTNTPYYVIAGGLTADNFELSETSGGAAVDTTGDFYVTKNYSWKSIAYGDGLFVAVSNNAGVSDVVMTSTNGEIWTSREVLINGGFSSIVWNGSIFCAVSSYGAAAGAIITSTDGITWTSRTAPSARQWSSIAWNGSIFCAVALDGAIGVQVMTSPDGITWTSRTSASAQVWQGVSWNGSVFAAVASDGAVGVQVMTSPDGIAWTSRTSASAQSWKSIAWNGTVFCAVAQNGAVGVQVMTSPDGITWTSRTSASAQQWQCITWGNSTFVAIANNGTVANQVMTSPDGITWTSRTSASAQVWQGVVWGGDRFIAVAQDGGTTTHVMVSSDGITWDNNKQYGTHTYTTLGYGFPEGCTTVSYMNGRFIACEPNTQNFYVSEVLDGWYWDALNVQTVDSNPDYVTAQVVSHNECIVFCEYSGEVFYDSGSLPSPFVRNQSGIFEVGCNAPFSISVLDNSIFWLGQSKEGDGIVYRLNGYTPTRISTYSIEQTIKSFTTKTDAKAFSYQLEGHHFYVLTFPTEGKTFVYDANTNLWHERASFISSAFGRWEANDFLYFNGVQYVTDYNSTKLYSLDVDTYSNGSNPIKVVRSFRTPQADLNRVPHNRLMLDAEVGTVGINESEPQIMMRWSDDLGYTWSNLKTKGLGAVGEYFKRVTFNRLGATKGQPRVYELSSTSDAKIVLLNVYIE